MHTPTRCARSGGEGRDRWHDRRAIFNADYSTFNSNLRPPSVAPPRRRRISSRSKRDRPRESETSFDFNETKSNPPFPPLAPLSDRIRPVSREERSLNGKTIDDRHARETEVLLREILVLENYRAAFGARRAEMRINNRPFCATVEN